MLPAELEVALRHFLGAVRRTAWEGRQLTCSIGALQVQASQTPEELYLETDKLLYAAKSRGRNRYVIGRQGEAPGAEICGGADL